MNVDEIRQHLGRVGAAFASGAKLFEAALSSEHAKIDTSSRAIPAMDLAEIYGNRRDVMRSQGVVLEGIDALVAILQSAIARKWIVVGVSGGAYWGALFIPDDGSATACIGKRSS
jgi:hypothetical protein